MDSSELIAALLESDAFRAALPKVVSGKRSLANMLAQLGNALN